MKEKEARERGGRDIRETRREGRREGGRNVGRRGIVEAGI